MVVFSMSTHFADKYIANGEFYDYYQTVIVAADIEHVVLVAYIISCRKVYLYI